MPTKITQNGDKVLRQIARELTPAEIKSPKTGEILAKMAEAMDAAENGVAIAAPQIGESLRIFLVDGNVWHGEPPVKTINKQPATNNQQLMPDTKYDIQNTIYKKVSKTTKRTEKILSGTNEPKENIVKRPPIVFINPVIKKTSKKQQQVDEGCLSVDGIYGTISRSEKATVEALNENGKKFSRGCSGLLAQIIQHETDHLNGVLFIDKAKNLQKIQQEK